jgi:hypothetical protein
MLWSLYCTKYEKRENGRGNTILSSSTHTTHQRNENKIKVLGGGGRGGGGLRVR